MSLQKGLDATPAKTPAEQAAAHPNWNVQNHEVLQQIRQDRTPHVENKTAVVQAQPAAHVEARPTAAPPRAEVQSPVAQPPHAQVSQGQLTHRYEGTTASAPQAGAVRPEVAHSQPHTRGQGHSGQSEVAPQVVQTYSTNPQQIAQNQQRYIPNHQNNNSRQLYGGLAAGALIGGGAAYYSGGDNYNNYAYGQNYDGSFGPDYGIDPASPYNQFNQFGQIGNPNTYVDNGYLNADSDQYFSNPNPSDNIYGGTTFGGPQFDGGIVPPQIYESNRFGGYPPPMFGGYERDRNPIAAIPALFGNLIGGVLGAVTGRNQRRYYDPDC